MRLEGVGGVHVAISARGVEEQRGAGLDALRCRCGGIRTIKRYVTDPKKIREVLEEIGVWREAPRAAGAHRPPQGEMFESDPEADGVDPPPGSDDAA